MVFADSRGLVGQELDRLEKVSVKVYETRITGRGAEDGEWDQLRGFDGLGLR